MLNYLRKIFHKCENNLIDISRFSITQTFEKGFEREGFAYHHQCQVCGKDIARAYYGEDIEHLDYNWYKAKVQIEKGK